MTEEEAKTKWCPMVRPGRNRNFIDEKDAFNDSLCIGSDCMMWRTYPKEVVEWDMWGKALAYKEQEGGYCSLGSKW